MKVTSHERPGVYSVYEASALISGAAGSKWVGLAAVCADEETGSVYSLSDHAQAVEQFGAGSEVAELVRLLFLNGAAGVAVAPVKSGEGAEYTDAFAALEALENISVVVCDSTDMKVQQALRDSVVRASEARRERIGVVAGAENEGVARLVERAGELNSNRMVLVAAELEDEKGGVKAAAAVAGAIAAESDAAVPLGGAELSGLPGLSRRYSDTEIDALVQGGVTALESTAGVISVVRGVTTHTGTTWRELTSILIVDDVIPTIRNSLRERFQRTKNTEQNRGAIRAQVVLELENKLAREIITDYGEVTVSALEENPTVCLVEFSFSVAHGLNQIWLSAHITV